MQKPFFNPAMVELRDAITEAETLTGKADVNKRDELRLNVLLAKIAALRSNAVAPDDFNKRWFRALFSGSTLPVEQRGTDILAGTQSITYTQTQLGGTLVPNEFWDSIIYGISQNDPLLDEDVVTLIQSKNFSLRPFKVPGWDLSSYAAAKVTETSQQNPQTVPTASTAQLGGYTYRATLDGSFEWEEDAFEPAINFLAVAYAMAFARGIGADLVTGNGTSAPQGLLAGAHDSGITTLAAGSIDYTDIEGIYFALDAAYRHNPKCAWVMNDAIYKQVRKAHDINGRPLINVVGDRELLMDKPIRICPSMPSTANSKGIVLGDLAHLVVRCSRLVISRDTQAAGYVEAAKALYTGRMRADAKVVDPTGGGASSPIIYATLHA